MQRRPPHEERTMTSTTTRSHHDLRELDARSGDGLEVELLWSPASDALVVRVLDAKSGDRFELDVGPDEALDAFRHPFAYATLRCAAVPADPVVDELESLLAAGDER
jgi:hypothetical protein